MILASVGLMIELYDSVSAVCRQEEYFASPYAQFHAIFLCFMEIHLLIINDK